MIDHEVLLATRVKIYAGYRDVNIGPVGTC